MNEEPRSLSGEVEPAGDGEWVSQKVQAEREGVKPKAIYRRVKRSQMLGRRNPVTGEPEVWVPAVEEPGSSIGEPVAAEPRSLAVPEREERFLILMEQAVANAVRLEEVARENGELRARLAQERAVRAHVEADRDEARRQLARRGWLRRWLDRVR